jgi:hypothetical protein
MEMHGSELSSAIFRLVGLCGCSTQHALAQDLHGIYWSNLYRGGAFDGSFQSEVGCSSDGLHYDDTDLVDKFTKRIRGSGPEFSFRNDSDVYHQK